MGESGWIGKPNHAKFSAMHKIAVYDMDKTITTAPTWTPFLIAAAQARAPWRLAMLPIAGGWGLAYKLGIVDRAGVKARAQRLLIGRALPDAARLRLAERFAAQVKLRPGALAQIAADRAAGYRLVLATASFGYYAEAIAKRLGFDAVIATEAARDDAGWRPRLVGENCYGPAKLRMIGDWLAGQGIARDAATVRFYSDHVSDAPSLAWADQAFAVNPDPRLRRLAQARGWPVLDWR